MARKIETGNDDVLAEATGRGDHIACITLNRPERRNALSGKMLAGLASVLEICEHDPEIRAIVLTGAGRGFCAGGDVKGMASDEAAGEGGGGGLHGAVATQRESQRRTVSRLYRMPKPVLASLPGAAAGAGMGLCMACDFRIAADNAIMTTAFARVGFSGDYGLPWLLSQQVGRARALELFYFSDKLDAQRCLQEGLVNWVVPEAQLWERTLELAERLAAGPTIAHRYIKENVNAAFSLELEEYMNGEVLRHHLAGGTRDHAEAVQAFVEKREPVFEGR
ncbi:MAG: enoyl-CoA hydratase-related protein [Myxococcales bacterium]|nr:enoyl-CoA hydratase-related protein [Myxococcales bacterium]